MTPAYVTRPQIQSVEGIAVTGEAMRRATPDSAEFLIEITASGTTATQAIHHHQTRTTQIAQALSALGVQQSDLNAVSMNVMSLFTPPLPALSAFAPQLTAGAINALPINALPINPYTASAALPETQLGTFQARSIVRVLLRDAARAGEVADALSKTGIALASSVAYHAADETLARRSALEAAGKDARAKAEALAATAGKQLGDPVFIVEDIVASNGVYSAMRAQAPWAFGPDTPQSAGELEYYARVTASFRFQ
jgi:uncharacterized protein YggE